MNEDTSLILISVPDTDFSWEMPDFIRASDSGNLKSQIHIYTTWAKENEIPLHAPDLNAYRDYLIQEKTLSPKSALVYLSSVRERYRSVLRKPNTTRWLYQVAEKYLPNQRTQADLHAFVNEIRNGIYTAIDPKEAKVKVGKDRGDGSDFRQIRLKIDEAKQLLLQPDTSTLTGLRDKAIISLALATGIRQMEMANLIIEDLYAELNGQTALHVRRGKGSIERLIPFGAMIGARKQVENWLNAANIQDGFVFRRVFKGEKVIGKKSITTRSLQRIIQKYPIEINGKLKAVHMHDLRRTYARRLYDNQMDIYAIKNNMGHSHINVTLLYIGALDANERAPKDNLFDI